MNATYRLQLRSGFGFAEVRALLPYFQRLGISHLYLSPITEARPGSAHGYDVVDHNRIREELGGEGGFASLLESCRAHGLALVVDFVPNHAAVGPENARWQDVLAYGPYSPYARYFDIEWDPLKPELRRKILLPFLGRPYGTALDQGEIVLHSEGGRFFAAYHEHRFAISPATYAEILDAGRSLADEDVAAELAEVVEAYAILGPSQRDELNALRPRLAGVLDRLPLPRLLAAVAGERLHRLLERQFWRLAYWKTAAHEINYRRFFYINDLVALRIEDDDVYAEVHRLLSELGSREGVEGVRVDHIDGLLDPHQYLARLQVLGIRRIWVEKILATKETLPEAWPVEGTTGYEFLNDALGALTWPGGEIPLDRLYRRMVRDRPPYPVEVYRSKRHVMQHHLAGELFRLAYDLDRISEADYRTRDFSFEALREAISEVIANLDRYRTYLPHDQSEAERVLREAVHRARRRNPAAEPTIYDFLLRVLLGEVSADLQEASRAVAGRFQQYASVVMAKGVEDTALYRYVRAAALNEVGGDPDRIGFAAEAFHARARFRALRYPRSLLATATHDHKRGEDTRMRLAALGELSELWRRTLDLLVPRATRQGGDRSPASADIYLFVQTLAALWEDSPHAELPDRLAAYMQKAAREANLHTGWANPDSEYEARLDQFVRTMLADPRLPRRLRPLARALARAGFHNSLTQLILKVTAPGVPDIYQGCELLDLSLVDPDNRAPVDFARRQRLLAELEPLLARPDIDLLQRLLAQRDERLKLYCLAALLRLRRAHPGPFGGGYRALPAEGEAADHLLAYARSGEAETVVVILPRFPAVLEARGGFGDTRVVLPHPLSQGDLLEGLTGAVIRAGAIEPARLPLPWAVFLSSQRVQA